MEKFLNKTIFLDTAPFIYFIEAKKPYFDSVQPLFVANARNEFKFISSALLLLEVLVAPIRENKTDLVNKYESVLTTSTSIQLFDINNNISKKSAELRANYSIKTPDAIQLATAIIYQADYFLTNDRRLKKVK